MATTFVSDRFSSNHVEIGGKEYLFFSGTSYLGLNHNEELRNHIIEGLSLYGASYGSSRNSNLQLKVYEEAEKALAKFAGSPAAMTVSSGFAAGQLVVNAFRGNHHFLFAPDTHPAVCLEPGDAYPGDFGQWAGEIAGMVAHIASPDVAIVCNAVDPLFCNRMDFDWVHALPADKRIVLIIDDSHGLGVTGENGGGIYSSIQHGDNIKLVVISSLAKAMGLPGGVILGDRETIAFLQKSTAFRTASPMAPAFLYAFSRSTAIYAGALKKLQENITFFTQQYPVNERFRYLPDYPVFYTAESRLPDFLNEKKIIISSFPYPKADSDIITRIIINANHNTADIGRLADCLKTFSRK